MLPNARTVLLRVSGNRDQRLLGIPGQWVYVSGEVRSGYSGSFASGEQVVINHNLGRKPTNVSVYTHGGVEIVADFQNVDLNRTILNFCTPTSGVVEIS